MIIVYFLYGLAFFTLGILTLFVRTKDSKIVFADKLWLVGFFGITHAIVEWIDLYSLVYVHVETHIHITKVMLLLVSYLFLFEFSRFIIRKSFEQPYTKFHFIYKLYSAKIIYPISFFIFFILAMQHPGIEGVVVSIRYTFGFWSSVLVGVGLYYYSHYLLHDNYEQDLRHYFKMFGITFIIYAFLSGVVVSHVQYFESTAQ